MENKLEIFVHEETSSNACQDINVEDNGLHFAMRSKMEDLNIFYDLLGLKWTEPRFREPQFRLRVGPPASPPAILFMLKFVAFQK